MAFDCLGIGDGLYQTMSGDLEVLLAPDSALEILPGGEGVGGLSVVTEQRTVAPVAFSAYSVNASIQTATSTSAIAAYETEEFDLGSDYNTGTYTFTAPIDGVYMFTHYAQFDALGSGSGVESGWADLYLNGSTHSRGTVIATDSSTSSDAAALCVDVFNLSAADTIQPWVRTSVSNALIGGDLLRSRFTGTLIKAT